VLRAGELLVMPSPRLRNGFLMLDPGEIHEKDHARTATIRDSFSFGVQTTVEDIPLLDLIVYGPVAVTEG
jgi:5-formyltetrahydrofolate cyclo-ligase